MSDNAEQPPVCDHHWVWHHYGNGEELTLCSQCNTPDFTRAPFVPEVMGWRGDGNLQHVIARQRNQLALMQGLFDRSNQQQRYLRQRERTQRALEAERKYRHILYEFADVLAEVAKAVGTTSHGNLARDILDKHKWLGR